MRLVAARSALALCSVSLVLALLPFAAQGQPSFGLDSTRFLTGLPTWVPGADSLVHVVVEIPAGTSAKWQVCESGVGVEWEERDGQPRVVLFLPYPGNYGIVPQTRLPQEAGGDGDPLDLLVLGPAAERGSVLAVRPGGPLGDVRDASELPPGVLEIVETWFTHYEGAGVVTAHGIDGAAEARRLVREAQAAFEK